MFSGGGGGAILGPKTIPRIVSNHQMLHVSGCLGQQMAFNNISLGFQTPNVSRYRYLDLKKATLLRPSVVRYLED